MEPQRLRTKAQRLRDNLAQSFDQTRQNFWKVQQHNIRTFRRQPLAEISGSFGDLGTLLPLMILLTEQHAIYLSSTLVFSGLANIATGVLFGIPLPVQPMKAIAAVAIAQRFSPQENASAGLFVAAVIGLLSITGLIHWLTRRVPVPVVKGIQVGTGLSLISSAGKLYDSNDATPYILVIVFLGLLASASLKRIPYALILLVAGVIAVVVGEAAVRYPTAWPTFSIWKPRTFVPSSEAFAKGTLDAGIGQVPLTALNSVIAVTFLAADLLPEVPTPTATSIGLSVTCINLIGAWFGAMPVCHGSGGLAAQYRFGARSGSSIIFLGLVKFLLGLFAERIAEWLFVWFPKVLLLILVVAAGLELVKVGESLNTDESLDLLPQDQERSKRSDLGIGGDKSASELTIDERKQRWTVMAVTVAGILAFHNDAIGFVAGMLCHWSFQLHDRYEAHLQSRRGPIQLGDD
ncbi:uncharacterized protein KY384_006211 [Bacidia gigantensis]|uniref:uncharacterized protein n=1 Tax=Bacidia gigantensis TaxID=2732470 RepID=UPI001D046A16|nr:uncharacterized protein KY384_006211 [Bacidia gigantensis]KAG8529574.1 hypothetical protein KY384_006211 [Bacidia gigantensis]